MSGSNVAPTPTKRHTRLEDALAVLIGTLIIALGVSLFSQAGLLTGSTAGIAFLLSYTTSLNFGEAFFLINIPFYLIAIRHIGWEFTLKTFASVFCLSFFSDVTPRLVSFASVQPVYVAVIGGFLMGVGFLMLFRHDASLGGINILSRFLADKYGWSIGKFQMLVDLIILSSSLFIVDMSLVAISVIGSVALNMIIAVNHKPGRYLGNVSI
ncbi:hypothetical protein MSP8886_03485 [Marinomonas spartinae]|uniref:YitT family protein n=1 Tax=Marinomonas spartinae TaxID=1792290 RepID=A0A1A8TRF2_9GAMM|nr:YitT family protein [Marinomonas spartinae]SBS35795.1 hypothetical protein MSP8886_03485 [Marinomonas spartinae]